MTALAAARPAISHRRGSALVLLAGLVLSFNGLAFRLTDDISAWAYLFFRGVGVMIVTAALFGLQYRGRITEPLRRARPGHLLAGAMLGMISTVYIVALDFATVAFVLFFQSLAPITSAYFSWLLLRERVSRTAAIATALSLAGVMVMVSGTITDDVRPAALIAALIPVGFGWYATTIRSADQIDPAIPVLVSGVIMLLLGSTVAVSTGAFDVSARDALIGIFAGSVLLGLPLAIFNTGQRVVPSPETSLLLMIEVLGAPLWVWLFVSETPEPTTIVGGTIILAAVVWLIVRGAAAGPAEHPQPKRR